MKWKKLGLCMLVSLMVIGLTVGMGTSTAVAQENGEEGIEALEEILENIVYVLVTIAGGITTVALIFCVFMWQKEKAENPDSQEAADWKMRAVKVLIGLIIILAASTIIQIVSWIASPAANNNMIQPALAFLGLM